MQKEKSKYSTEHVPVEGPSYSMPCVRGLQSSWIWSAGGGFKSCPGHIPAAWTWVAVAGALEPALGASISLSVNWEEQE